MRVHPAYDLAGAQAGGPEGVAGGWVVFSRRRFDTEQGCCVAIQDGGAFRVADARRVHYEVHLVLRPGERAIRSNHQLACSDFRGEVTHAFLREHHRAVLHLLEISGRGLPDRPVRATGAGIRAGAALLVGASGV